MPFQPAEGQRWGPFVVRGGRVRGTWPRRLWALLFASVSVAVLVAIGVLIDLLWVALVLGLLSLLWWGVSTVRLLRGFPIPVPPPPSAPPSGEGGVREPRRPRPHSPAGAAALPIPDEDATSGPGPRR
jgi:hypothetical protein